MSTKAIIVGLACLFFAVGVVVGEADKAGAADSIPECNWEEIVEEESRQGNRCALKHAEGNEEHVCDRMFKAERDEARDRKDHGGPLGREVLVAGSHPDGHTDERVAQDTSRNGGAKAD